MQHTHTEQPSMENGRRWLTPLRVGWMVLIGLALGSMLLLSVPLGSTRVLDPTPTPTSPCEADRECSDGLYCNGNERCERDSALADSRGCVPARAPACNAPLACDEDEDRCVNGCTTDADKDGHIAANCGGDDCDDHDARRHPRAAEFCDAEGRDEDCDPTTYGQRDRDRDGEDDFRCFNRAANGAIYRGTDYDDNGPAVRLGSMICDGSDAVVESGLFSSSVPCPTGTKCVVQPNRTGICIVPPANYVPPPRFEWPLLSDSSSVTVVTVGPPVVGATGSAGGSAAEVAECKSTLQAGKVSWGGGTSWASANIDKLCNGTKNARNTIACFQSNVEALGWAAAIDKCK